MLWESSAISPQLAVAYPNFLDWRIQNKTVDLLAAQKRWDLNMTGLETERIIGSTVSTEFLMCLESGPSSAGHSRKRMARDRAARSSY
jgi:hypothetical protein